MNTEHLVLKFPVHLIHYKTLISCYSSWRLYFVNVVKEIGHVFVEIPCVLVASPYSVLAMSSFSVLVMSLSSILVMSTFSDLVMRYIQLFW